ncbi:hypothetical protein [Segatella albensis]|jgi:hypothetical protein|uniref:hypothetical protein n=1 Tax=Segatella albensis TaxID=77768 RepID=UPI0003F999CB|nr:hypothetical protein [Segatella albensis]
MKKENFDKINSILQQYYEVEEQYYQLCLKDNEMETWERENDLDSLGELLVIAVADVLNDERDNIK